jgi:hypothetical protein
MSAYWSSVPILTSSNSFLIIASCIHSISVSRYLIVDWLLGLIPNLIVAALSSNILWGKCVIEIDAESAADGMSKELNIFFRLG